MRSARSMASRPYGIRVSRTVWLRHELSLAHEVPRHPERPERIKALEAEMERHGWFGCDVVRPRDATREQLLAVHPARHIDFLEELCATGGGHIDMDTVAMPATFEAAVRAAGGAVALVDELMSGAAATGFAALRPPGHHAEPARAMGFCFFGNAAVAARHASAAHGASRVRIVDWDGHHGNGTNAIFHADPGVLFVSIHESPLYPGTGPAWDTGEDAGEGFTVNLPVPGGSGDEVFCPLVEPVVVPLGRRYDPGLILVSAGYDAHADDPLAGCAVSDD